MNIYNCDVRNGESDACKEEVDVQMRRYEKEGTAEEDNETITFIEVLIDSFSYNQYRD